MPVTDHYYGLTFGELGQPSEVEVLRDSPCEFNIIVVRLQLSSTGPTDHLIPQTASQFNILVPSLPLASSGVTDHVLVSTATQFQILVEKLSLASSGVSDHVITQTASQFDIDVFSIPMTSSGVTGHVIPSSASQFDIRPEKLSLSSSGLTDHVVAATSSQFDITAASLMLGSSGVTDHTVVASPSHFWMPPNPLSLTSSGVSGHTIPQSAAQFALPVNRLALSSSGVTGHVIPSSASQFDIRPEKLSLSSSGVSDHLITQSPAHFWLPVNRLSLSSSGVSDHVLPQSAAFFWMPINRLSLSSSGVTGHVLPSSPCHFFITPTPLSLASEPAGGMAVCFQGAGYLNTGPLIGGYNKVATGYVAIWFRYDGGNPDIGTQFRNTLFMAQKDTEERLEFRIEEAEPFGQPDLVIESDDGAIFGFQKFTTDLGGDGGPDLYDGAWHLLMFARDVVQGWYFIVDGVEYPGRTGTNASLWFDDIQNTSDFDELNIAASKIQAPSGNQRLYGCVDELLVVNNRIYSDVLSDAIYLYNDGSGKLIPDIEAENVDNLWTEHVYNAWEFKQNGVVFGTEYVDPEGDQRFNVTGTGYTIVTDGISG